MSNKTLNKIYSVFKNSSGISTDSRILKKNSIFFALKTSSSLWQDAPKISLDEIGLLSSLMLILN